jgi:hypothetical protein
MSNSGKKHNALKHGVHTQEIMLWSEKEEDYESLRADLYPEWAPNGSMEDYLVSDS